MDPFRLTAVLALLFAAEPAVGPEERAPALDEVLERLLGEDLEATRRLELSVEEAVARALRSNLDIRITERDERKAYRDWLAASAVFDPYFNAGFTHRKIRNPQTGFILQQGLFRFEEQLTVLPLVVQDASAGIGGLTPIGTTYGVKTVVQRVDNPLLNDPPREVTAPDGSTQTIWQMNPRQTSSIRVDISQPLLKGFGPFYNTAEIEVAARTREISEQELARVVDETILSVERAYWALYQAQKGFEARRESLREALALLDRTIEFARVGRAARIDVLSARASAAAQESGIVDAWNEVLDARAGLLAVLNHAGDASLRQVWEATKHETDLYDRIEVVPTSEPGTASLAIDMDAAIRNAFLYRPEIKRLQAIVRRSEIDVGIRRNEILPQLDLVASWENLGLEENLGNSYDELMSGRFYNWSIGAVLEIPIGSRAARNRIRRSKEDLAQAKLVLRKLENDIVLDVTSGIRSLRAAQQRVRTTETAAALAREQLAAETERLAEGKSTAYTVLQVRRDLLDREVEAIRARVDHSTAIATLRRAMGTIARDARIAVRGE
ncbi:MAG: TolC family protein [Planctomycetes bacterium]|nr:TolC family protein [Planctomycetota bacterium]